MKTATETASSASVAPNPMTMKMMKFRLPEPWRMSPLLFLGVGPPEVLLMVTVATKPLVEVILAELPGLLLAMLAELSGPCFPPCPRPARQGARSRLARGGDPLQATAPWLSAMPRV